MDKLTAIKIKHDDGTYSDEIPISVIAENVEWDNSHNLVDILGSVAFDTKGTIQDQISQLFNEKVDTSTLKKYVANELNLDVTNWLNTNVNPVGSAVVVDSSLTVSGAGADAKVTGDKFKPLDIESYKYIPDIWHLSKSDVKDGEISPSMVTFENDSFSFSGPITDNYFQTIDYNLDPNTEYNAEVYCDADSFAVYAIVNYGHGGGWDGSGWEFLRFSGDNKEKSTLTFTTPSTGIVKFRFTNAVANVPCKFTGFKVYKKEKFINELFTNGKEPYTGDKRINFTVDDNGINIPCTIMLPSNYSQTGKPIDVVLLAHGSGMKVSKTEWIETRLKLPRAILSMGMGVFDCNGFSPTNGDNWGCQRAIKNYYKCYQYVINHYNVNPIISVCGLSMGGLIALNFAHWYPSVVKSIGLLSPVTDLYTEGWQYDQGRKNMIATAYNFDNTTSYDLTKTIGCDPYKRIFTIGEEKMLFNHFPTKMWQGAIDTAVSPTINEKYIEAVKNGGNYGEYVSIPNVGHDVWGVDDVNTNVAEWFKSFI